MTELAGHHGRTELDRVDTARSGCCRFELAAAGSRAGTTSGDDATSTRRAEEYGTR